MFFRLLTIPNLLSILRILLIPVYVLVYFNAGNAPILYPLAAGILTISCLTDFLDGYIARHYHQESLIGKILDPLADKLTQFSVMLCIAPKHPVFLHLAGVFLFKECFQMFAALLAFRKGKVLPGALFSGKISTTILFISQVITVLYPGLPQNSIRLIVTIDLVFLLMALFNYALVYTPWFSKLQDISLEQ